jgi:hypothetical protein
MRLRVALQVSQLGDDATHNTLVFPFLRRALRPTNAQVEKVSTSCLRNLRMVITMLSCGLRQPVWHTLGESGLTKICLDTGVFAEGKPSNQTGSAMATQENRLRVCRLSSCEDHHKVQGPQQVSVNRRHRGGRPLAEQKRTNQPRKEGRMTLCEIIYII